MDRVAAEIALLTERRYVAETAPAGDWYLGNILHDDQLLSSALADFGLRTRRVDWNSPAEDWAGYRLAVFRTTWDYFDRYPEFAGWLDRVEQQTRLCNECSLVRWNIDKHYLADLQARGVAIVPSRFLERGTAGTMPSLRELLAELDWPQAVVKPCVSGGARHTYRLDVRDTASLDRIDPLVRHLLQSEAMMLQPFVTGVVEQGEDSLMMIGGRFTHAVRKVAKAGDFRVQDDHGGTVHRYQPTAAQVALAEQAISACQPVPTYGRVDMVQVGVDRHAVMELELIEPELWLRFYPPAATALAAALAKLVQEA